MGGMASEGDCAQQAAALSCAQQRSSDAADRDSALEHTRPLTISVPLIVGAQRCAFDSNIPQKALLMSHQAHCL